jgi:hypothetical protein
MKNSTQPIASLFVNSNPTGVTSTPMLNAVARYARTTDFFKNCVSQEGFEINPIDFKWEWIINFNNRSGFVVLRQHGNHLRVFVYKTQDDTNWKEIVIRNFKTNQTSQLIDSIKHYRNSLIK